MNVLNFTKHDLILVNPTESKLNKTRRWDMNIRDHAFQLAISLPLYSDHLGSDVQLVSYLWNVKLE